MKKLWSVTKMLSIDLATRQDAEVSYESNLPLVTKPKTSSRVATSDWSASSSVIAFVAVVASTSAGAL